MSFEKDDRVVLNNKHSEFDGKTGATTQVTESMFGESTYTTNFNKDQEVGTTQDQLETADDGDADEADEEWATDDRSAPLRPTMPRVLFHYIDLRTFYYEMEDQKRVERVLWTFLPDEFDVGRIESIGHHGDRIIAFSTRAERANDARYVLDEMHDPSDFETPLGGLGQHVMDNTELFLRLDRQAVFKNETRRSGGFTPRARVETYSTKKEAAVENARDALLDDEQGRPRAGRIVPECTMLLVFPLDGAAL